MLQQRHTAARVISRSAASADTQTMQQLAENVDAALAEFRQDCQAGRFKLDPARLVARMDEWLRTDEPEYLDRTDVPDARKRDIMSGLHRFNRTVFAYKRFMKALQPLITRVHQQERRPVRMLELASGGGDFTLELARQAARQGLPVSITGSDYVAAHVDDANEKAGRAGIPVDFRVVNAFDMDTIEPGEFDIVFIIQTMHHFSAGQLAMMMNQARQVAGYAFVGIDGYRSLQLFGLMPLMAIINPQRDFLHDSFISIRRMYSEPELAYIASLAVPDSPVRTFSLHPGYSGLEINCRAIRFLHQEIAVTLTHGLTP